MATFATAAGAPDELQTATAEAIEAGIRVGALKGLDCSPDDIAAAQELERTALERMRTALDQMAAGA